MTKQSTHDLQRLASLYGVQTAYHDINGNRRSAEPEILIQIVRALGAPVRRMEDAPHAIRQQTALKWRQLLEPVILLRGRRSIQMRLPAGHLSGTLECRIRLENGEEINRSIRRENLDISEEVTIDGEHFCECRWKLPEKLPYGYHKLSLEVAGTTASSLVIDAPRRIYHPEHEPDRKIWGIFAPLYSIRTQRDWGGGDLSDLRHLLRWTKEMGGDFVGTLPLFPAFLDAPFEPSPYMPVSRLFWNEITLDPVILPEFESTPEARKIVESPGFRQEIEELRSTHLVDYMRVMALKRRVLEPLVKTFFHSGGGEEPEFQSFLRDKPEAWDYARFRSMLASREEPWHTWPTRQMKGSLDHDEGNDFTRDYHLYIQYSLQRQIDSITKEDTADLYLDFPLGVHPDGFDAWRHQDLFVRDAAGGAPPDDLFRGGQNWGFPPLHPQAIREEGHRYFINSVRHIFRPANMVRIDHVMGLHRLFWVPQGAAATQGVYVRYPADELYAILCLESHRSKTILVGEDLGTVPEYVRESMDRSGVFRCSVLPFQMNDNPDCAISATPQNSIVGLNTHDTATFAGWWEGRDIDMQIEMKLVDTEEAGRARDHRGRVKSALIEYLRRRGDLADGDDAHAVLEACLRYMAVDPVHAVIVNLEDLWNETTPQNVPGTASHERPNWRQKMRLSLEEAAGRDDIVQTLRGMARLRKETKGD